LCNPELRTPILILSCKQYEFVAATNAVADLGEGPLAFTLVKKISVKRKAVRASEPPPPTPRSGSATEMGSSSTRKTKYGFSFLACKIRI